MGIKVNAQQMMYEKQSLKGWTHDNFENNQETYWFLKIYYFSHFDEFFHCSYTHNESYINLNMA